MPLTFAHPVAVLPLRRSGLPMSALVVGSLAPDLEFLLHLAPRSTISHTAVGLFVFCLPAGLLLLAVLHGLWKKPFFGFLKGEDGVGIHGRVESSPFRSIRPFSLAVLGVLIGTATHLVWDSFTHDYGWVVLREPALRRMMSLPWGDMPLYKGLQHGSSLLGLGLLAALAVTCRSRLPRVTRKGRIVLASIGIIAILSGTAIALRQTGIPDTPRAAQRFIGIGIVGGSATMVTVFTVWSLLWHARRERIRVTGD